MPPEDGTLQERLTAIVVAWSRSIAEAPTILTVMSWLSLGPDIGQHLPESHDATSPEMRSLRDRIAQQYLAPFGRISTLAEFDYEEVQWPPSTDP